MHKHVEEKNLDKIRGSSANRGYDRKWRKARDHYLRSNPLCVLCMENGLLVAANVVDHKQSHKGSMQLFWDTSNWQALCDVCHNKKTAIEDGGFGRRPGGRQKYGAFDL